ncbi:MAG: hypothetical protein J6P40_00110 [Oscillospiraceae bacterium]|nr:hypothetical protein [Oscillospiraceae bacterium]
MKYLEFFVLKLLTNLFLVNLIVFVGLPMLGIELGLSFFISILVPVVLAGAAVEREKNKEKQLQLFDMAS